MTREQDSAKAQECIEFTKRNRSKVDALRPLVAEALQQILEGDMEEALGAGKWERTGARLGYRSGYYERDLITRIGKVELRVPRDRQGRFRTELFDRYERSEEGSGAGACRDVHPRGIDAQGKGDHGAIVRTRILRVRPSVGSRST